MDKNNNINSIVYFLVYLSHLKYVLKVEKSINIKNSHKTAIL